MIFLPKFVNAFSNLVNRYVVNHIRIVGAFLVTKLLKCSCQSLLRTDWQGNDTGLEWQIFSNAKQLSSALYQKRIDRGK